MPVITTAAGGRSEIDFIIYKSALVSGYDLQHVHTASMSHSVLIELFSFNLYQYCVSKTSLRVRRTLSIQPYGGNALHDGVLRYGDFSSRRMSKIDSSNYLMIT